MKKITVETPALLASRLGKLLKILKKNYPEDLNEQRTMLTNVLDYYISIKDTDNIALWLKKL